MEIARATIQISVPIFTALMPSTDIGASSFFVKSASEGLFTGSSLARVQVPATSTVEL